MDRDQLYLTAQAIKYYLEWVIEPEVIREESKVIPPRETFWRRWRFSRQPHFEIFDRDLPYDRPHVEVPILKKRFLERALIEIEEDILLIDEAEEANRHEKLVAWRKNNAR